MNVFRCRGVALVLSAVVAGAFLIAAGSPADAQEGRFTIRRDNGTYFGVDFVGASGLDTPLVVDTNADRRQELAVYRNGRFTIRRDNGTYFGVDFAGADYRDSPLAVDSNADGRQELAVYRNGRFTIRRDDGTYYGVDFAGASGLDTPLVVDSNADGRQELAVYRSGRFTIRRDNGTYYGVDFAGASGLDTPLVVDSNADGRQELAVYRNGRFTIRRDNGTYYGVDFAGASGDDLPLAVDTNADGRQELAVYDSYDPERPPPPSFIETRAAAGIVWLGVPGARAEDRYAFYNGAMSFNTTLRLDDTMADGNCALAFLKADVAYGPDKSAWFTACGKGHSVTKNIEFDVGRGFGLYLRSVTVWIIKGDTEEGQVVKHINPNA